MFNRNLSCLWLLAGVIAVGSTMLCSSRVDAQDRPMEIRDRLDDVRQLLEAKRTEIELLQQSLNQATDEQDEARIEQIRDAIKAVREEVAVLQDLEDVLNDMEPRRPSRSRNSGTRFGGNSSGDRPRPEFTPPVGVVRGAGTARGSASDTRGTPEFSRPGGIKRPNDDVPATRSSGQPRKPESAGVGGSPQRPDRREGERAREPESDVERDARGKPTSSKLRALEASYQSLIEAGDMELAAEVLVRIHLEKKRLEEQVKKEEREQREREKGIRNGGAAPDATAGDRSGERGRDNGPRPGMRDRDRGAGSRPMTVQEIEDAIRQLQEELDRLRERQENGGGARR